MTALCFQSNSSLSGSVGEGRGVVRDGRLRIRTHVFPQGMSLAVGQRRLQNRHPEVAGSHHQCHRRRQ